MRIACIGDIVGRPGRNILTERLSALRQSQKIDFVIANGENAAAGSGLSPKILENLLASGIDVVTSGDHIYKNKEVLACIDHEKLLRPLNYPDSALGKGYAFYNLNNINILVINLIGRVFLEPAECPFLAIDKLLAKVQPQADLIFIDFHAEATSEKIAMGWHCDSRVTGIFGTHTHVQTADERILPQGTAYITDLGMTGPFDSIIGRDKDKVLKRFLTQMPSRFDVAKNDVKISGIIIKADPKNGKASMIERISIS